MEIRIKSASGAVLLLSGLPTMAQEAALKASAVNACASCPKTPDVVTPPGDPTMLIAGAFILGVIVGFAIAKALDKKKQ